jgi:hypothetical protein
MTWRRCRGCNEYRGCGRAIGDPEDLLAVAADRDFHLPAGLYRPHQRRLRRPDHAGRPAHERHRLRFRVRHLLLGLFHFRGSQQHHHGEGRRPALDRAHHDLLGAAGGGDRVRDRNDQLRRAAVPAGAGGGRFPAGPDPVFHLLAAGIPSRARGLGLSGRPADRRRAGFADLDRVTVAGWLAGAARMAAHVSVRGYPDRIGCRGRWTPNGWPRRQRDG